MRASRVSTDIAALDMARIYEALHHWLDRSVPVIPDALIEQFILQVVVVDDNIFNWTLDLNTQPDIAQNLLMSPSEMALQLYRDKQKRLKNLEGFVDTVLNRKFYPLQSQLTKQKNTVIRLA